MVIVSRTYKGKNVLYADYRGCKTPQDLITVLDELANHLDKSTIPALVLSNYIGVHINIDYMNRVKELGKKYVQAGKIGRSAVVGLDTMKNILYQGYLRFSGEKNNQAFETEATAMDWLVS